MKLLSFFTGAGFLDLGFLKAGFSIVWNNEYNSSFVRGYEHGMNSLIGDDIICGIINKQSIVNVTPRQIVEEAFGTRALPSNFGIIGGPPCPDFSVGGKNLGKSGDRGKLSQTYIDRVLELEPLFFLYENVPGLLKTRKHRRFMNELESQLSTKYSVSIRTLNALEYGVPQDRDRVFIVGFKNNWIERKFGGTTLLENDDWFPWPEPKYKNAKKHFNWPVVSPFGGSPKKPDGIPDELMVGPIICNEKELKKLPNSTDYFKPKSTKFSWISEGDVSRKSFKRLHRWSYSPTVAYGNNEVHLHPIKPRRLTVREAMRIQSVPDGYSFPVELSLSDKFKMIGNGVPPKLSFHVAKSIKNFITGEQNG